MSCFVWVMYGGVGPALFLDVVVNLFELTWFFGFWCYFLGVMCFGVSVGSFVTLYGGVMVFVGAFCGFFGAMVVFIFFGVFGVGVSWVRDFASYGVRGLCVLLRCRGRTLWGG